MKRFQECNKLEQLYRLRWYVLIPFQWLWSMYVKPIVVWDTSEKQTGDKWSPRGKNLWKLLKGAAQGKMRWYWTHEEVKEQIKNWEK